MLVSRSVHYDSHRGYLTRRRKPGIGGAIRYLVQSYEGGVRVLCQESANYYER